MKIAFVNDSCERLGVEYISSLLKTSGHQTKLFMDPQLFNEVYIHLSYLKGLFDYKNKIIDDLKVYRPDLIGISVDTEFYQWACAIAKLIKQEMDIPIIFGGIHPTSVPERVIKNDFVDMVCVGEGEYPMLELANSMEKGRIDYSIRNIWFKRGGQIIKNELRPLIDDLDSLPLSDHGIYYETSPHFRKGYYLTASRGCPYRCSYCCHSYLSELYQGKGKYLRQRSVKNVMEELVVAKNRYNIDTVIFADDCFGYDTNWLREFSYEYREKVGIRFICSMYPMHISPESVLYLKQADCRQITLGVQSWDVNIRRDLLNREISNVIMEKAMRLVQKEKITLIVDNIFGFPNQNEEEFIQSLLFYTTIKPRRIFFYNLKYYPKTAITEIGKRDGFLSTQRFEETLEGRNIKGVYFNSFIEKKTVRKETINIQILLYIFDCLPSRIACYIIQKKLYRYLPSIFNPAVFVVLRTLFSFDLDTRILRARTLFRYSYFIRKILFQSNLKE